MRCSRCGCVPTLVLHSRCRLHLRFVVYASALCVSGALLAGMCWSRCVCRKTLECTVHQLCYIVTHHITVPNLPAVSPAGVRWFLCGCAPTLASCMQQMVAALILCCTWLCYTNARCLVCSLQICADCVASAAQLWHGSLPGCCVLRGHGEAGRGIDRGRNSFGNGMVGGGRVRDVSVCVDTESTWVHASSLILSC